MRNTTLTIAVQDDVMLGRIIHMLNAEKKLKQSVDFRLEYPGKWKRAEDLVRDDVDLYLLDGTTLRTLRKRGLFLQEELETAYGKTSEKHVFAEEIEVAKYMETAYGEPLQIEALAKSKHIDTSHFGKRFRSLTGQTVHAYLMEIRMYHAQYLLSHTDKQVKEIAFLIGYGSSSYFCSAFKKRFKITPIEYRKMALKARRDIGGIEDDRSDMDHGL